MRPKLFFKSVFVRYTSPMSNFPKTVFFAVLITLLGALAPTGFAAQVQNSNGAATQLGNYIVIFQPGFARANSTKLIKDSGGQVQAEYSKVFNGAFVRGPEGRIQALAKNPNVVSVEADAEVTAFDTQSNPPSWGLDRIDQTAQKLDGKYNDSNSQGLGAVAYVVDTGIDGTKSDIAGRVQPGFSAVLDGYGTVDCNGHGTHVSGTVGGTIYGVAKLVRLVPVRVLDCRGSGSTSSVVSGLEWIAGNASVGTSVVNMSLGGAKSISVDAAVDALISRGIPVVVAAGNSNANACNYSPARVANAITVGATDSRDNRASYSNFGTCLDIFAPGTNITSLWFGSTSSKVISGTSMAAPHVTGAVARILGETPSTSPSAIATQLTSTATPGVVKSPGTGSPNLLLFIAKLK